MCPLRHFAATATCSALPATSGAGRKCNSACPARFGRLQIVANLGFFVVVQIHSRGILSLRLSRIECAKAEDSRDWRCVVRDDHERNAALVGLAILAVVLCAESLAAIRAADRGSFVRPSINWSEPVMRISFIRER
jgi:hypothetical protein